ncbi:MAG: hypothetical protein D6740_07815, partial [Alphaproteobacteria bacterium]
MTQGLKTMARKMGLWGAVFLLWTGFSQGAHAAANRPAARTLPPDDQQLELTTGKGVLLRLAKPATDIFVADPAIADVQVKSAKLVYVLGKKPGETSIYAIARDDTPVFAATVRVTTDVEPLKALFREMLPDALLDVHFVNGMAFLTGVVRTPEDAERAKQYAKRYLGEGVISRLKITQPTQINLRVKFAEVGRETLKQLGVNWQSLFDLGGNTMIGLATGRNVLSGRNIVGSPLGPLPGLIRDPNATDSLAISALTDHVDLNAVLDALETEGLVTVLAEPNLTAVSGETA